MQRTRVGNVQVISALDASMPFPGTDVYPGAGERLEQHSDHLNADGGLQVPMQTFVLVEGASTILVDTGLGPDGNGQLLRELDAAGIQREQVYRVIFTHLHVDHIGWSLDRASGQPNFPNAQYLVPQKDWDFFAGNKDEAFEANIRPLEAQGRVELFDGERPLTDALTALPTPGHTPGHTSIAIDSQGERGFILGDVVISPIDAAEPDLQNMFDSDHDVARKTRRETIDRLVEEGALVGASHMPEPGLGRFVRGEGRQWWQGITLE